MSARPALAHGLVIAGAAVSLLLAFLLLVFRSEAPRELAARDGYSISAVGHRLLLDLLRELRRPVVQSRFRSGFRAQPAGTLVVVEPDPADSGAPLQAMLAAAPQALLVLPKRRPEPAADPRLVAAAPLLPAARVADVLDALGGKVQLVRTAAPPAQWRGRGGFESLPDPVLGSLQLLQGGDLLPLFECDAGVLLGAVDGPSGRVHVLSDPDLLANHGLSRGRNAEFAVGLLDRVRRDGGLVFDEVLHGHELEPSVFEALGRWPLVLLLAHLLLLLAAVLWTAATRFGTELPPPPAIEPGKRFLIENIAGLLHTGGHSGHAAQRWVRDRLRESAQALHAPPGLDEAGIRAFVLQAAARRTGGARLPLLLEAAARRAADHADGARLTASLREIHETLAETVHGSN